MAQLNIELSSDELAALHAVADELNSSPATIAKRAIVLYLALAHAAADNSDTIEPNECTATTQAATATAPMHSAVNGTGETPATVMHDHSAFGALKGKIKIGDVVVTDGVEYQRLVRG